MSCNLYTNAKFLLKRGNPFHSYLNTELQLPSENNLHCLQNDNINNSIVKTDI